MATKRHKHEDISEAARRAIGENVGVSAAQFADIMSPCKIIDSRGGTGPAPPTVRQRLQDATKRFDQDRKSLNALKKQTDDGRRGLDADLEALLAQQEVVP